MDFVTEERLGIFLELKRSENWLRKNKVERKGLITIISLLVCFVVTGFIGILFGDILGNTSWFLIIVILLLTLVFFYSLMETRLQDYFRNKLKRIRNNRNLFISENREKIEDMILNVAKRIKTRRIIKFDTTKYEKILKILENAEEGTQFD